MKVFNSLVCLLTVVLSLPSFAGNGGVHGGFVLTINDQVKLEDTLKKAKEFGYQLHLEDPVNKDLKDRIMHYLELIGARGFNVSALVNEIFNPDIEYRFTEKLPDMSVSDWQKGNYSLAGFTDEAGQVLRISRERFGWTEYNLKATLLRPSLFFAMSLDDQALGIIHERLHAKAGDSTLVFITDFIYLVKEIDRLKTVQKLKIDLSSREPLPTQIHREKERIKATWSANDYQNLVLFAKRARQLGFLSGDGGAMRIFPNGGGLCQCVWGESTEAFITIDSVYMEVQMGPKGAGPEPLTKDHFVAGSFVSGKINDEKSSVIVESSFLAGDILNDLLYKAAGRSWGRVQDSQIIDSLVEHSNILNSTLEQVTWKGGDISDSTIHRSKGDQGTVIRSRLEGVQLIQIAAEGSWNWSKIEDSDLEDMFIRDLRLVVTGAKARHLKVFREEMPYSEDETIRIDPGARVTDTSIQVKRGYILNSPYGDPFTRVVIGADAVVDHSELTVGQEIFRLKIGPGSKLAQLNLEAAGRKGAPVYLLMNGDFSSGGSFVYLGPSGVWNKWFSNDVEVRSMEELRKGSSTP